MVEAKNRLAELVGQVTVSGRRYILSRRGQPVAVLISVDEYRRLQTATPSSQSMLPTALRQRQEALLIEARRLEERLGDPVDGLVALLSALPADDDPFWVETQEAA
jgi:prevent-host-death family protein